METHLLLALWLWAVYIYGGIHAKVNIATHGELWYCNSNPSEKVSISPLSMHDLQRISKLEQVQVMTRHGTRTSSRSLQEYFPNSTQYYHCNISTITSRVNLHNTQYSIPMLTKYEDDNQFLLHSNCEFMQSWPTLPEQHHQNAQILIDAYLSSDDKSKLFDIQLTNQQNTSMQHIKLYTSNYERCKMSTMSLAARLLNVSASTDSTLLPVIETTINDVQFNPYTPWDTSMCTDNAQYQQWQNVSTADIFENYIFPNRRRLTEKYQDVMRAYTQQGGVTIDDPYEFHEHPGFRLCNFYCNGMDIPLQNETFWKLIEMGKQYAAIYPNRSNVNDEHEMEYAGKFQCKNHFYSIPMYHRFLQHIAKLMDGESMQNKFILHSAHDSSIVAFLSGLNLFDGEFPYFAQFFTLEIYSSDMQFEYNQQNDIRYLFRFTRAGKFVPYEHCAQEYQQLDTELCDLNVLLQRGFADVNITQREWAQKSCATLMDDCVCGYCGVTGVEEEQTHKRWMLDAVSFVIGIVVGLLICVTVWVLAKLVWRKRTSLKQLKYQRALGEEFESDLEINTAVELQQTTGKIAIK